MFVSDIGHGSWIRGVIIWDRIFWSSKHFEGKTTHTEPWYGTAYSVERIDDKFLKVIRGHPPPFRPRYVDFCQQNILMLIELPSNGHTEAWSDKQFSRNMWKKCRLDHFRTGKRLLLIQGYIYHHRTYSSLLTSVSGTWHIRYMGLVTRSSYLPQPIGHSLALPEGIICYQCYNEELADVVADFYRCSSQYWLGAPPCPSFGIILILNSGCQRHTSSYISIALRQIILPKPVFLHTFSPNFLWTIWMNMVRNSLYLEKLKWSYPLWMIVLNVDLLIACLTIH